MDEPNRSIALATHHGKVMVQADVYGSWAVHRGIGSESNEWCITHLPSGRRARTSVLYGVTKDQAVAIAKRFDEYIGGARVTRDRGRRLIQIAQQVLTKVSP